MLKGDLSAAARVTAGCSIQLIPDLLFSNFSGAMSNVAIDSPSRQSCKYVFNVKAAERDRDSLPTTQAPSELRFQEAGFQIDEKNEDAFFSRLGFAFSPGPDSSKLRETR